MEDRSDPEHDDGTKYGTLIVMIVDRDHYQATYTKIFLQFPQNFWFDTQVGVTRYLVKGSLDDLFVCSLHFTLTLSVVAILSGKVLISMAFSQGQAPSLSRSR